METKMIGETKEEMYSELWDIHTGLMWAHAFLEFGLRRDGVVVEVGPGKVDKIARGLEMYKFKGTLYVVEPDKDALGIVLEKYRLRLPQARIEGIPKTLLEASEELPKNIEAIVSNHPLDDMILCAFLNDRSRVFYQEEYNQNCGTATRSHWNALTSQPELLKKIKEGVVNEWSAAIEKTSPRLVLISQYESYYFKTHGIIAPDKNAYDVLERLKEGHSESLLEVSKGLADHLDQPSRWLFLGF